MDELITHTAGGVVLNTENKVLVVNQKGNSWSLPKGHVEAGEDLVTAAKREVYEESGITQLQLILSYPSYERYKIAENGIGEDTSEKKVIHFFLFTTPEMHLRPVDPDNPEARWVDPAQVPQLLTHQKDKAFFELILSELSQHTFTHVVPASV